MPEMNIEEKIQEALKKKSFKDNKMEYLGLSLVFCLFLYITFVIGYFIPFLAIFIFFLVDIPLIMGFKHFIWFGPASGETLIEGFKVSLICGYLNFISYIKIFVTTNLKPLLIGIVGVFLSIMVGSFVIQSMFANELQVLFETLNSGATMQEAIDLLNSNEKLFNAMFITETISMGVGVLTFFFAKLTRGILPYVSFLRLTNLEGKSMEGVITHTKKIIKTKPSKYYFSCFVYHLLYLLPIGLTILAYFILSNNPVNSMTTITLISSLVGFVAMFPAILFVELNYRNFCIQSNQEYIKEHKKMLNDAINDLKGRK